MKNKQFLLGVIFTLFIFLALGVGKAYAAGCFTDTNATAACWLKANGIATAYSDGGFHPNEYLKRIDAATFLYRANKVPPRQGDFHISQDLSSVIPSANSGNGIVARYPDYVLLRSSANGTNYYHAYLTIPTSMYGRAVFLKGMKVCYNATSGNASLSNVGLNLYDVDSAGDTVQVTSVSDVTTRTDKTCRLYMLTTPTKLAGDYHATAIFWVDFGSIVGEVRINALTAILSPSLQPGVLDAPDVLGVPPADTSPWFSPQE
jgi:hypothetical protein